MILLIGGFAQGKTEYAMRNNPSARQVDIAKLIKDCDAFGKIKGFDDDDVMIITGINDYIRDKIYSGISESQIRALIFNVIDNYTNSVIITDECGNGIVPMEKRDRDYRDALGHIQIELASKAERVERIVCGIPMIIK